MKVKTKMVAGLVAVMALAPVADAALAISNGDFNAGYPGSAQATIDGWNTATAGNFWDNAFWDAPFSEPLANLSPTPAVTPGDPMVGSWLYQGVGTSDGAADLQISLDFGTFGPTHTTGLNVGLYVDTAGTFVAANDLDVVGTLSLVDSTALVSAVDGVVATYNVTFDLTGVGAGDQLYLRLNNYDAGTGAEWTSLDNIQIIPEPATIGLVGVCGAGVLFIRRRFRF